MVSSAIGGYNAISTKPSGTSRNGTKRTGPSALSCLKLLNGKLLTINAPASAVTSAAKIRPGRPGSRHSLEDQMKAETIAAAEGLGKPSKKRLSPPERVLKRASRSAAQTA